MKPFDFARKCGSILGPAVKFQELKIDLNRKPNK